MLFRSAIISKVENFVCGRCKGIKSEGIEGSDKMEIEPGISVERVDRFCYLGEMLGEEGGSELAVENRVGKAWGSLTQWHHYCATKAYRGS